MHITDRNGWSGNDSPESIGIGGRTWKRSGAGSCRKLEGLFEKQVGKRLDLPYGVCACRTYEGIELKRKKKDTELAEEEKNLDLKQVSGKISYGKWEISYRIFEKEECRCQIPKKNVHEMVWLWYNKTECRCTHQKGWRFIVIDESGGRQKLKSYFINKKYQWQNVPEFLWSQREARFYGLWAAGRARHTRWQSRQRKY